MPLAPKCQHRPIQHHTLQCSPARDSRNGLERETKATSHTSVPCQSVTNNLRPQLRAVVCQCQPAPLIGAYASQLQSSVELASLLRIGCGAVMLCEGVSAAVADLPHINKSRACSPIFSSLTTLIYGRLVHTICNTHDPRPSGVALNGRRLSELVAKYGHLALIARLTLIWGRNISVEFAFCTITLMMLWSSIPIR